MHTSFSKEAFWEWRHQALGIMCLGYCEVYSPPGFSFADNAVMTQVMVALCTYQILEFLKFQGRISQSLQQISRLIHVNLFAIRDLMALFKPPPNSTFMSKQMRLL